jgi:3-hydroxyisobutyrate dehydrogenase
LRIGIPGTGKMGTAIAGRLLKFGHEVTVWNRTPAKVAALVAAGAKGAATATQLAEGSDIVMTILTDAAAIDSVYLGPAGLLAGNVSGKLFVEMSTVAPDTERNLAEKVRAKGAAFIDSPVGGTVGPASEGKLYAFMGGDAADVARIKPLFEVLCRRMEHMGPVGAGAAMKLAANLTTQVWWQTFGEALTLLEPLNIEPQRLMDIFLDTSGATTVLNHRQHDIVDGLLGKELRVNFDIESVRKDMRTMIADATARGRHLPVTERVVEVLDQTIKDGNGKRDCSLLPALQAHRDRK